MFVYGLGHGYATACVWRSQDNLQELFFSFYYVYTHIMVNDLFDVLLNLICWYFAEKVLYLSSSKTLIHSFISFSFLVMFDSGSRVTGLIE